MAKKPRSDKGPRLTDRDLEAISWIAEQYAISLDHLQILLARLRDKEHPGPQPLEDDEITSKSKCEEVLCNCPFNMRLC